MRSRENIIRSHPQNPLPTVEQLHHLPGGYNRVFNSEVFRYGDDYKAILRIYTAVACRASS